MPDPKSAARRARKSSAKAAAQVGGTSARSVEMAKTVHKFAPDLHEKMGSGRMSLHRAYQETRARVLAAAEQGIDIGPTRIQRSRVRPCTHCNGTGYVVPEFR